MALPLLSLASRAITGAVANKAVDSASDVISNKFAQSGTADDGQVSQATSSAPSIDSVNRVSSVLGSAPKSEGRFTRAYDLVRGGARQTKAALTKAVLTKAERFNALNGKANDAVLSVMIPVIIKRDEVLEKSTSFISSRINSLHEHLLKLHFAVESRLKDDREKAKAANAEKRTASSKIKPDKDHSSLIEKAKTGIGLLHRVGGIVAMLGTAGAVIYGLIKDYSEQIPVIIGSGIGALIKPIATGTGPLGRHGVAGLFAWAWHGVGNMIGGDLADGMNRSLGGVTPAGPIEIFTVWKDTVGEQLAKVPNMLGRGIGHLIVFSQERDGFLGRHGVGGLFAWALSGIGNMIGGDIASGINDVAGGTKIAPPSEIFPVMVREVSEHLSKLNYYVGAAFGSAMSGISKIGGPLGKDGVGGMYAWAWHGVGSLIGGEFQKGMLAHIGTGKLKNPIDIIKGWIGNTWGYMADIPKSINDALGKIGYQIPTAKDFEKSWESLKTWAVNKLTPSWLGGVDNVDIYNPFRLPGYTDPKDSDMSGQVEKVSREDAAKIADGLSSAIAGGSGQVSPNSSSTYTQPDNATSSNQSGVSFEPTAVTRLTGDGYDANDDTNNKDLSPHQLYDKYKIKSGEDTKPTSGGSSYGGNPAFKPVADLIASSESGTGPDAYHKLVYMKRSGGRHGGGGYMRLTDMTVGEVLRMQSGMLSKGIGHQSTAVGRYQFIRSTLSDMVKASGTSLNEKFSPSVQDRLFEQLAGTRGKLYDFFETGDKKALNGALARIPGIWVSIKNTDGSAPVTTGGNKATVDSSRLYSAIISGAKIKSDSSDSDDAVAPAPSATMIADNSDIPVIEQQAVAVADNSDIPVIEPKVTTPVLEQRAVADNSDIPVIEPNVTTPVLEPQTVAQNDTKPSTSTKLNDDGTTTTTTELTGEAAALKNIELRKRSITSLKNNLSRMIAKGDNPAAISRMKNRIKTSERNLEMAQNRLAKASPNTVEPKKREVASLKRPDGKGGPAPVLTKGVKVVAAPSTTINDGVLTSEQLDELNTADLTAANNIKFTPASGSKLTAPDYNRHATDEGLNKTNSEFNPANTASSTAKSTGVSLPSYTRRSNDKVTRHTPGGPAMADIHDPALLGFGETVST